MKLLGYVAEADRVMADDGTKFFADDGGHIVVVSREEFEWLKQRDNLKRLAAAEHVEKLYHTLKELFGP